MELTISSKQIYVIRKIGEKYDNLYYKDKKNFFNLFYKILGPTEIKEIDHKNI
jgi:hypothetical protein